MSELSKKIERLEARLGELAPEFAWSVALYEDFERVILSATTREAYGDPGRHVVIRTYMGDVPDADSELVSYIARTAPEQLGYFFEDNGLTE